MEQAHNFWDEYRQVIVPKLEKIDIMLKTVDDGISIDEVCRVLSVAEEEVFEILQTNSMDMLDKGLFLKLLNNASSYICCLYQREVSCGSPYIYSAQNISYIYDIPLDKVNRACKAVSISAITSGTLPLLFRNIYLDVEK